MSCSRQTTRRNRPREQEHEQRQDKQAASRGVPPATTAICTVGKEGAGLTYRGYDIDDLAEHARFEEVAYLLLYGELPNARRS